MSFKKYLLAGLLVWIPVTVTVWLLSWMVGSLDAIFRSVLEALSKFSPANSAALMDDLGQIHGLGVILVVLNLLMTGAFA